MQVIITNIYTMESYFGKVARAIGMTGKLSTNFFPFWVKVDITHPDGTKGWQRALTLPFTGFWRASFLIRQEGVHKIEAICQLAPFGIDIGELTMVEFDSMGGE